MKLKKILSSYLLVLFIIVIGAGCSEKKEKDPTTPTDDASIASCEGCHTNYETLKRVHTPDPPSTTPPGCGGDAPVIFPYDRVFIGGEGYTEFKNSVHGRMPCTACHGGVDNTSDKKVAHSGSFIPNPSDYAEQKCASCHTDIYLRTKNSLHEQGWGQKSMVVIRSGLPNIPEGFDRLSAQIKQGYNDNCARCHATCGDCHVNRPKAAGGGLLRGHAFSKPDMKDNCIACHSSRVGHAYLGQGAGTQPDVHLTQNRFTCTNCHTKNEIHGDGQIYDQRYKMPLLPKCTDCHQGVQTNNIYHSAHFNSFSCNTCHSQDYNNCGSCHIGGDGARIASYQDFKIGINPIPETKPYKFAVLRRAVQAPDSWKNYGVPLLSNFSARPTYKYATPHNIIRWTDRTRVSQGQSCYEACHIIRNPDGTYKNRDLYLFRSDLLSWELEASAPVVVDGKLPNSWNVP